MGINCAWEERKEEEEGRAGTLLSGRGWSLVPTLSQLKINGGEQRKETYPMWPLGTATRPVTSKTILIFSLHFSCVDTHEMYVCVYVRVGACMHMRACVSMHMWVYICTC